MDTTQPASSSEITVEERLIRETIRGKTQETTIDRLTADNAHLCERAQAQFLEIQGLRKSRDEWSARALMCQQQVMHLLSELAKAEKATR